MTRLKKGSDAFVPNEQVEVSPHKDGALSKLTFAAKELFDVKGFVTGCGNPHWKETHDIAITTAPAVEVLLNEGATFVGKTISDEMAFSLDGENVHYGTPLNPFCPTRIPGGSSSGSVSAVAQGLVDFALGTDTAGSIRVPASHCGVYGFRPTHGRISTEGIHVMAPSFDVVGWFASSIDMLSRVGSVLLNASIEKAEFNELAIPKTIIDQLDPNVRSGFTDYLSVLPFHITEIVFPGDVAEWLETLRTIQWWELNRAHGVWVRDHISTFGTDIRGRLENISSITLKEYKEQNEKRHHLQKALNDLLTSNPLVLFPTVHDVAPKSGRPIEEARTFRASAMTFLCYASVAGLPQLSMPLLKHGGCPLGLSLLSARGHDEWLLGAAKNLAELSY